MPFEAVLNWLQIKPSCANCDSTARTVCVVDEYFRRCWAALLQEGNNFFERCVAVVMSAWVQVCTLAVHSRGCARVDVLLMPHPPYFYHTSTQPLAFWPCLYLSVCRSAVKEDSLIVTVATCFHCLLPLTHQQRLLSPKLSKPLNQQLIGNLKIMFPLSFSLSYSLSFPLSHIH